MQRTMCLRTDYHYTNDRRCLSAWNASVTWYTRPKLAHTKILQNFWLTIKIYGLPNLFFTRESISSNFKESVEKNINNETRNGQRLDCFISDNIHSITGRRWRRSVGKATVCWRNMKQVSVCVKRGVNMFIASSTLTTFNVFRVGAANHKFWRREILFWQIPTDCQLFATRAVDKILSFHQNILPYLHWRKANKTQKRTRYEVKKMAAGWYYHNYYHFFCNSRSRWGSGSNLMVKKKVGGSNVTLEKTIKNKKWI